MSDLVLATRSLDQRNIANQLDVLQSTRRWINESFDSDEINDALKKARLIKEWVRIQKASAEISTEAARLEATALRRLTQIGALDAIDGSRRAAAKGFAEMTDDEFEDVMATANTRSSATGMWKVIVAEREEKRKSAEGYQIGTGEKSYAAPVDRKALYEATRSVIAASLSNDGPMTITGAAMELADTLDLNSEFVNNATVRRGLKAAIRDALGTCFMEGEEYPDYVTYRDEIAGWVHVPFVNANLDQVIAWANFREEQAKLYALAAERATAIAVRAVEESHVRPSVKRVADLLRIG